MKMVKRGYISINYLQEDLERDYPGTITNEVLFKDFAKYLREDARDPANLAMKSKAQEHKDYKLIPKKCWDIIHARFGGQEIVRQKDPDSYARRYNIRLPIVS